MRRSPLRSVALAVVLFAMIGSSIQSVRAEEKVGDLVVKEWLDKYHDANAHYVIFPNGQIFTARAKWTGVVLGALNLWHCFGYMPLDFRGDESIYVRARVVHVIDADAIDLAARYKTQCALRTYPGSPHAHVGATGRGRPDIVLPALGLLALLVLL